MIKKFGIIGISISVAIIIGVFVLSTTDRYCFIVETPIASSDLGDNISPVLNHPADIVCTGGGQNISWVATDNNPETYEIDCHITDTIVVETLIYRKVDSGSWVSGIPIEMNINRFVNCSKFTNSSLFNIFTIIDFEITVQDLYNNSASDSVRVLPGSTPEPEEVYEDVVSLFVLGIVLISCSFAVIVVVEMRIESKERKFK